MNIESKSFNEHLRDRAKFHDLSDHDESKSDISDDLKDWIKVIRESLESINDFQITPKVKNSTSALSQFNVDEHASSMYPRPGMIINNNLVKLELNTKNSKDLKFIVKKDLQEMYDFVRVNQQCWDYLSNWYDFDYEVRVKKKQERIPTLENEESSQSVTVFEDY